MTTKKLKVGNVPNLRFPGFEGEWETKKLGEIVTNKSEKYNPANETDSIKCIELEHLATNTGQLLGYIDGSSSGSIKNVFYEGDVLFGKLRPYLKKYLQAPFNGICSSEIWVLKGKNISNDFLYRIVQTKLFIDLANQSSGSKMPRADWNIVENGFFSIPPLPEQSKIASFFSLLDERITTQNKIIENLKTQMLGLQEKIFRQMIKLKDHSGKILPLWSFKKGGELFESISNKNHNSDLPILAITQDLGAIPRDLIDYQITVTERSVESYKVVEIDNFIISLRSFQGGIEHSDYKGICSPAYIILKNKVEISANFYKYYFKTPDYIKLLNKKLEGIRDGKMISYSYFAEIELPFPSIEEQKRIASFLSKIDQKIQTEKVVLEQLEMQKKYLLQQMFV